MHRKVSVITTHSSVNYGSVLQTYATDRVFNKLNCKVEFVDYIRKNNTDQAYADRMQNRTYIKIMKKATFGLFNHLINDAALKRVEQRAKPMREFLDKYVTVTPKKYWSLEELKSDPPEADIYCTGSDQVWNSVWNGGVEYPYFLDFAPEGKLRIAYAASIGRDDIDDIEIERIKPLLDKYSDISMREISGVKILEKMGIKSTWVIDPTLMLNRDEWLKIAEPIKPIKRKYLLAYVLNWNDKVSMYAKKIAYEKDLEIIRICKPRVARGVDHSIKTVVIDQVGKLLNYFDKADIVITDSFHATAFSLNFHKNLIVVPPERFSTRIDSILELTGTRECVAHNENELPIDQQIDWNNVDLVLEHERQKAFDFLEKAINR